MEKRETVTEAKISNLDELTKGNYSAKGHGEVSSLK